MVRYEKLSKQTPARVVLGILGIGLCLSYGIMASGLVAIYALIGLLAGYFYPESSIIISGKEAIYLGVILAAAAVTVVMLSFLAYFMNTLSRITYRLSRVLWVPAIFLGLLVWWQSTADVFTHHISDSAVLAVAAIVPLCGILPALFLSTPAARKLHRR